MTLESILSRRSIRKFQDKSVPNELVTEILKAAMAAPSANNKQPWHFIVVKDKKHLQEIAKVHPYAKMASEAALAIIVCGDPGLEFAPGYWIQDCSAATQNILLAAHELGLGAVWCGVYPREERVKEIKEAFEIPDNIIPLNVIPIGYPGEEKGASNRYDPNRIHMNKW
ncbi:MAG: nitroreductase family protein [SAR324 cluster bacterium]|uniref:Nitroreductase family protein n=1 Tax=SAR324 cluster bacterium TaxID=2024889 RepID=A0A7X9IK15_9DELT|nr:nitroreductase family protein [SAR324 cluster bacterium]